MRVLAEIFGIGIILLGAYFGFRDIVDRWVKGPDRGSGYKPQSGDGAPTNPPNEGSSGKKGS